MTKRKETTPKYTRKCALRTCRKEFTTTDARQIYCSRAHGNTARSKRWYKRASVALKQAGEEVSA